MKFTGEFEFRGYSKKTTDSGKTYYFVHIEDFEGEAATFNCTSEDYLVSLQRGDEVTCYFDYSSKYNSLRIYNVEVDHD